MIGILVAIKTFLEIDAVVGALGALDAGLNIAGLFSILKAKLPSDSIERQMICALDESFKESCKKLGWAYDSMAAYMWLDVESILTATVMTKESLQKLLEILSGREISENDVDVYIDCFDKSVAGKEKLFRYLTQKWMRYMGEENRAPSNSPLYLTAIPAAVNLIGCEEIIQEIHNLLNMNDIVSIHSNGGVGKTAVVARIVNDIKKDMIAYNSQYEHIAWITSTGDLKKDITGLDIPAIKAVKSPEEKYVLARDFLGKTSTFLVIDNMDDPPSEDDVNELNTFSGRTKILITTKTDISIGKTYDLKDLDECIAPNKGYSNVSIVTQLPQVDFFVGRSKELQIIKDLVRNDGKVCLYGMGGIGKSVLAKALCIDFFERKEYQNVVYIPVINGLLRSLADDKNLLIQTEGVEEIKTQSDYAYGYFKLNALESGVNNKTLLVIDNLETDEDPIFGRIVSLPYDLIICSRNPFMGNYTTVSYHLEEISDSNSIRKIFEQSYGRLLTDHELNDAAEIFRSVRNHTLAIALLGKQLKYYGYTPSEYIAEGALFSHVNRGGRKKGNDSIYEQLRELFDAKSLSQDEISVMKAMCLTPEAGISGHIMEELSGQECIEEIHDLKQKGWIQQDDHSGFVFLHPVVKEVVLSELGINVEDKEIQLFTNNLIERMKNSWDKPQEKLLPYKELALAYYFRFQFPSVSRFNQYLIMAKYLWVVNCPDLGIEIMNKVKQLFIKPDGSHMYSSQEAEALLQIGFIYQGKGDYKRAEDNLGLAARIFGNRYGAALSHLAQAKMSIRSETIEEIEPLLLESLKIREKYWSGTQSEAASYHLYAKVLSEYQYKLEEAVKYEKKADRFFSSRQPGSRNESSSKYILGWLNIQLSEDDEELFEYGLSLLEEAKNIRINIVGRYGFWMEDIYRKLGVAYAMKNDIKKAAFYFGELLEVAKNKYASDKSNSVIIEAHKYLERLYSQLGEDEKANRSKKYLRMYG